MNDDGEIMSHLEISDDGKRITWVGQDGKSEWGAIPPTPAEWKKLTLLDRTRESLEEGVFAWVNGIVDDEVTVVFSPRGGLDFNMCYSISSGNLLRISEAR
jgi:hypothetical protein